MISVLILTRDEERDLPECLNSVAWSDDINVVDSGSQDRTIEIARARGAHVTLRAFDNWSDHQNWCLENIQFKHPWVFYLDADERVTERLADQILKAASNPEGHAAFRVERRDFLDGRWLRHVQASNLYIRLFRPEKIRYERLVNPVSLIDGRIGQLSGYLDHFPFSKGWSHWFKRHNDYSTLEAMQVLADNQNGAKFTIREALFARDWHERRRHQKGLFSKLPARPIMKFTYLFLIKRGFLDGGPGLRYALGQAIYEHMITLKKRELKVPPSRG
jgi:glycosyltransferase involved in cell wall biosynthesis